VADLRPYEDALRDSLDTMLREAGDYFGGRGRLHETLRRLASRFDAEAISYALVGGLALGEHGYVRMTDHVDVLVTPDGLRRFVERCAGRGYIATNPGATRSYRDTESRVRIEFLVTGEFPGDGKPKAVAFQDPAIASVIEGIRVLPLPRVVELKLASGMTAPDRLRDLADVQELIKARDLDEAFGDQLDPSVRERYCELWRDVAARRDAP
jgi:hypothetical protein